jgi:hypothetical protein
MQKLTRAGSGVLTVAQQHQALQQQHVQSLQAQAQAHEQQQQLQRLRQQAQQQVQTRMPTKRRADGEAAQSQATGASSQQKRAYNNDSILSNLQSAYAVTQATRASRSAGSDMGLRSAAGTGRDISDATTTATTNANTAPRAMVTRKTASARVSSAHSNNPSSRFLPKLGGSAKR